VASATIYARGLGMCIWRL